MGRYSYSSKTEADSLNSLSVYWLKKHDYLEKGCSGSGGITWTRSSGRKSSIGFYISVPDLYAQLNYTQTNRETGKKKDFEYKIPLVTTPCNLGGVRYWFKCSMSKGGIFCGRRVATLYIDGEYFACRHCYNLTYSSKKENYRGYFGTLVKLINEEKRMYSIKDSIKRHSYAGRPTKKVRQFMKIASHHPERVHELLEREIYRGR
jgi:hypothetical protein